mgnify:FL=1|tara:strand:+ start:54 stop:329 length:276 start_codon:yes stop_codon:yes gene_type:complete
MKTLDYRSGRTIESTRVQMLDGCNGVKQVIFFYISESYNFYTDGTSDLFKRYYIKQDGREYVNIGEQDRFYETEKGYRNAIKRWAKKSILK